MYRDSKKQFWDSVSINALSLGYTAESRVGSPVKCDGLFRARDTRRQRRSLLVVVGLSDR
jgi:hypothetical protein